MLSVIPTPIGNLGDITIRALEILKQVDFILAEDTRVSGKLLRHYAIKKPMIAYHANNEHKRVDQIISRLSQGEHAALITDAGTPGISDPGFLLVRYCLDQNIEVQCLPGPTAFVPALVVSGLPCHRFYFEGFLPHKKGRKARIEYLSTLRDTFILYESPHRILRCLEELIAFCGPDRAACVCRELTKMYEEVIRGTLQEICEWAQKKGRVKGEIVLVIAGKEKNSASK